MKSLKKYLPIGLLNVALTLPLSAQSQDVGDLLVRDNKLVAVVVVLVVILVGIAFFLVLMERRIKRLEDEGND